MAIWIRQRLGFLQVYIVRCQYCRQVFVGIRFTHAAAQATALRIEVAHYKQCRPSHPIERLHNSKYPTANPE